MFTIEINYETGDSFTTNTKTLELEHEWKNIDAILQSLERIKNHYKFLETHSEFIREPSCKLPEGVKWSKKYNLILLELVDDNFNPFIYHAFWTGYFETLFEAKIIATNIGSFKPHV